MYKKVSITETE